METGKERCRACPVKTLVVIEDANSQELSSSWTNQLLEMLRIKGAAGCVKAANVMRWELGSRNKWSGNCVEYLSTGGKWILELLPRDEGGCKWSLKSKLPRTKGGRPAKTALPPAFLSGTGPIWESDFNWTSC
jgi:hypothetical protein